MFNYYAPLRFDTSSDSSSDSSEFWSCESSESTNTSSSFWDCKSSESINSDASTILHNSTQAQEYVTSYRSKKTPYREQNEAIRATAEETSSMEFAVASGKKMAHIANSQKDSDAGDNEEYLVFKRAEKQELEQKTEQELEQKAEQEYRKSIAIQRISLLENHIAGCTGYPGLQGVVTIAASNLDNHLKLLANAKTIHIISSTHTDVYPYSYCKEVFKHIILNSASLEVETIFCTLKRIMEYKEQDILGSRQD